MRMHIKSVSFAGDPVSQFFSSRKVSHYLQLFVTSTFAVSLSWDFHATEQCSVLGRGCWKGLATPLKSKRWRGVWEMYKHRDILKTTSYPHQSNPSDCNFSDRKFNQKSAFPWPKNVYFPGINFLEIILFSFNFPPPIFIGFNVSGFLLQALRVFLLWAWFFLLVFWICFFFGGWGGVEVCLVFCFLLFCEGGE